MRLRFAPPPAPEWFTNLALGCHSSERAAALRSYELPLRVVLADIDEQETYRLRWRLSPCRVCGETPFWFLSLPANTWDVDIHRRSQTITESNEYRGVPCGHVLGDFTIKSLTHRPADAGEETPVAGERPAIEPVVLPYETLRSVAASSVEGALADLSGDWQPGTGPGRASQAAALERARAGMRQVLRDLEAAKRV